MNNRETLKYILKVENLEDYIFDQYILGKRDAEFLVNEEIKKLKIKIEESDDDEIIVNNILSDLIYLKKIYDSTSINEYFEIINGAKEKALNEKIDLSVEYNEIKNISNFILEFYETRQLTYIKYTLRIKNTRESSKNFNAVLILISEADFLFKILNNLYKFQEFEWSWENFEKGLIEVLNKNLENKRIAEIDKKYELQLFELKHKSDTENAKSKIDSLNLEISSLNKKNENILEVYNKYYFETQTIISNTYFGDNQPFLFNVFNFLKRNNLLSYGWSYFYSCLILGNNEMIPLTSSKKLNFIGRIFYNLKDYLILEYKDEAFKFIQSKFLINEVPISDNFRTNHMKTIFNKEDDSELLLIDDFFEESKKIYLKS